MLKELCTSMLEEEIQSSLTSNGMIEPKIVAMKSGGKKQVVRFNPKFEPHIVGFNFWLKSLFDKGNLEWVVTISEEFLTDEDGNVLLIEGRGKGEESVILYTKKHVGGNTKFTDISEIKDRELENKTFSLVLSGVFEEGFLENWETINAF